MGDVNTGYALADYGERQATSRSASVPAPVLFVVGGLSMYVGAALAVGLFDRLAPSAVAVLRLIGAAAVLLAWRRPPAAAWRGRALRPGDARSGWPPG